MRKFLPYIALIVALLAGGIGWYAYQQYPSWVREREGRFAITNIAEVKRILLTSTDGSKAELKKKNDEWWVNDKYTVRNDLLNTLVNTITKVQPLAPAPFAAHDNILRDMMRFSTRVEIFDEEDKPVRVYTVGGPTTDSKGTYMLLEIDGKPASRPYITYIPGYRGYLTHNFCTDEEMWRNREIFHYTEKEIQSVSLEYVGNEARSFTINRVNADSFQLLPADEKFRHPEEPTYRYIRQYLSFFGSIYIESFSNNNASKDSILQATPYCVFTIQTVHGVTNRVQLHYMPMSERSKKLHDEQGRDMTYDADRYFIGMNGQKDLGIAQFYVFGKLLRQYNDFFFKPGAAKQLY